LEKTLYHTFIRIDQKGSITILFSTENIWFGNKAQPNNSSVNFHYFYDKADFSFNFYNKEEFNLGIVDKIRLGNETTNESLLIFMNYNQKKCFIFDGVSLFELDLQWF